MKQYKWTIFLTGLTLMLIGLLLLSYQRPMSEESEIVASERASSIVQSTDKSITMKESLLQLSEEPEKMAFTEEELIEKKQWIRRQIEINQLDMPLPKLEYDAETLEEILAAYEESRQDTIYPYAEKMGNCSVVCLAGDHMIYEQKPEECGMLVKDFIDGLGE